MPTTPAHLPFAYAMEFVTDSIDAEAVDPEKRAKVYRKRYWNAIRGDDLPPALAVVMFDCAIALGPERATKLLQEALGIRPDGVMGSFTLDVARRARIGVLEEILAARAHAYGVFATFDLQGLGWMRHLFRLHRAALDLIV